MKSLYTLCLYLMFTSVCFAQPANDEFCSPMLVSIGMTMTGSNVDATTDATDFTNCSSPPESLSSSVWYSFIGNGNPINISTCGANTTFDTELSIMTVGSFPPFLPCFPMGTTGCSATGTVGVCEFNGSNNALAQILGFQTTLGVEYVLRVSSKDGSTGDFDLEIFNEGVAPVELVNFWVEPLEKGNTIMWETASESNVLWHIVEKSANGIDDWTEAGKLVSTSAADRGAFYEVIDNDPFNNTYYRLRTVDYDATFQLSEVISIKRTKPEFDIKKVYPNPIMYGEVSVQIESDRNEAIKVRIMDITGKNVDQFEYEIRDGLNEMKVDVTDWRSGVYFIQFESRQGYSTRKIFKQE